MSELQEKGEKALTNTKDPSLGSTAPYNGSATSKKEVAPLAKRVSPRVVPGSLDPSLDFLSEKFDPVKVLRCSLKEVHLPHPSIQPCDNLQAYISVVRGTKKTAPSRVKECSHEVLAGPGMGHMGVADESVIRDPPTKKRKTIKTVVDFMERRSSSGPFSVLQHSWAEGRRVRVLMRHCAGLRGVCEGRLIAFDRHMNLVLRDVTEWCTPFRTMANGGITLSKNQRRRRRKTKMAGSEERGLMDQTSEMWRVRGEELAITEHDVMEKAGRERKVEKDTEERIKEKVEVKEERVVEKGNEEEKRKGEERMVEKRKCEEKVVKKRSEENKWESCRSVRQVFVRGDNVVLISHAL